MSVTEMHMLCWTCAHTKKDRIRNELIRDTVGVVPIEEKLIQHRLRWFGHIPQSPPEPPVNSGILKVRKILRGAGGGQS